jgi:peroxiredoxin
MMQTIEFVPEKQAAAPPAGPPRLTARDEAAPAVRLPDARGRVRELAALRRRNVVLVFFRGPGCAHCTGQLRELLREAGRSAGGDTAVVAVSGEPLGDPDAALRLLCPPEGLAFELLVDDEHRAFRAFSCFDQGPRHGLFLIDRGGVIRAGYVGDAPLEDARQVADGLRKLGARAPAP